MIRRFVSLAAVALYGSLDRVTALIADEGDYPEDDDSLATPFAA